MQGWAGVGAGAGKERLEEATLKEDGQEKSQDCPSVWEKAGQAFHAPPSSPSSRGNCRNKPASLVSPFSPHLAPKVGPQTIAPFSFQPPQGPRGTPQPNPPLDQGYHPHHASGPVSPWLKTSPKRRTAVWTVGKF